MDAQGYPKSSLGVVSGGSWGSPGALLSAPGLLWGTFWGAWDQYLKRFWMVFVPPGGVRRENGGKLEFDDPLNEIAMFSRPQASRNELKLVPKRAERRKKSRARTEKREKYADDRPGSVRERSRADRRPPGGGPAVRRLDPA